MKACTKCKVEKPLVEFHRKGKGGRRSRCKACVLARQRAYYAANREANREREAARKRAYYAANREQVLTRHRVYREANREKRNAYNRAYRKANREQILAHQRAYYEVNRERIIASVGIRRRNLEPPCEDTLEYMRWLRKDPCSYCGKWPEPGELSTIDHIVPVSQGGANHWTNLTAACQPCNDSKGVKPLLVWLVEQAYLRDADDERKLA